jgi:hypothetical protein
MRAGQTAHAKAQSRKEKAQRGFAIFFAPLRLCAGRRVNRRTAHS